MNTLIESGVIAIASHDAGGAEILSSLVRRNGLKPIYILDGPAKDIFGKKLGPIEVISIDEAVESASMLLCSTSWQSDLEVTSIKKFKNAKKRSIAFIDHWVNYQERFSRNGQINLPDEIWVGDTISFSLARGVFQNIDIRLVDNPYFLDINEEVSLMEKKNRNSDGLCVLYVTEPIKDHAKLRYGDERYWGYVEEEALRYFLNNLYALGKNVSNICIRPHPSEVRDKYNWAAKEFNLPISISNDNTLLCDIAGSDVVVGCESMAMVIGLIASKTVISCIPPGGRACVLPHSEIINYSQLISIANCNGLDLFNNSKP